MNDIIKKLNKNKQFLLTSGAIFVLVNLFTTLFIGQERFIYFWDFITYWAKYVYLSEHAINDTVNALETVFWSIREDNYNYLGACPLIPFGLLFGTSRLAFILAVVNIYALPAVYILYFLHKRINENAEKIRPLIFALITFAVALLSPDFWNPILLGFVDVGGVLLSTVIFLLYLKKPYSEQTKRDLLLMAILVAILVLFRRWYAYWSVSFYAVLFLEICLTSILARPINWKQLFQNLVKFSAQGLVSAVIFLATAPTLARRILGTDYTDLNSAYRRSENLFQSFEVVLKSFGWLYFVLFVLGAIAASMDKKTRKFTAFVLVQATIIFVLFARTQDFDSHHRYLLLPTVILFASFFLTRLAGKIKNTKVLTLGTAGLIIVLTLNLLTAFGPKAIGGERKPYPAIFTDIRHQPFIRHDFKEIDRLLTVLTELMTDTQDGVYVLASSDSLNSNLLNSAWMSLPQHRNVCKKVLTTSNIDIRHGFPRDLMKATYVLVGDPIQYHMNPKNQRVVGVPTEMFLEQRGIATSFEKLPYEFNLEWGAKFYLYKKIKPISDAGATALSEALRQYYPDRENVYKLPEEQ